MKETGDQDTIASARPKAQTEALPADSATDPFYDPSRDLPDVGSRFEIILRLGEGGMGEVYKARDLELDETVALKVLSAQFDDDQTRLDRLKQEVRLARKISSNGVCRIHDLVEFPNGTRGITMEYIEGQTLGQLIDSGLSVDYLRIAKWAADISEGLAAAHKLSIIHRDLKPDNIMITTADRAKILDFGVARHHESTSQDQRLTQEGMILGTVPYMAPEQLSNAPLDPRSDLYALGLILAEIITGDIPAYGSSYHETLNRRVVTPEVYKLHDHDPGVPEDFAAVVDHLLRTPIEERPFSAKMVADHLREYSGTEGLGLDSFPPNGLSSRPAPSYPAENPVPSDLLPPSQQPPNLLILLGVAILCVGLAIAVAKMTMSNKDSPNTPVLKPQKRSAPIKPSLKEAPQPAPRPEEAKPKIKAEPKNPIETKKTRPAKRQKKKRATDFIPPAEEL